MTPEEIQKLVEVLIEITQERQEITGYGGFLGGDPRKFIPDRTSCSEKEIEEWEKDCKIWNDAESIGEKLKELPCESGWITPEVHITKTRYGIGLYTYTCPTEGAIKAMKILDKFGIEYNKC